MTNTNHATPRQDQPPIEDLEEAEQDAAFDAMLGSPHGSRRIAR